MEMGKVSYTLRDVPDDVFSRTMNLPSGSTEATTTGPVEVRWYVVLADTSPRIIFIDTWDASPGNDNMDTTDSPDHCP